MPELTERDRGLLQNKIDELHAANDSLQDGIETDLREVNNLLLFDVPYKKYVDEKHYNIYAFEEELRLLTGKTIIGPVEEDAFWITAFEEDIFIQIKDGRFVAKKNDVVIVDVPIIPYRGFVVGSDAGTDFDIWTRDRYGSTTSEPGVQQLYTIHDGNNKIKVKIDGIQYETKIIEDGILEAQNGELIVDPFILSSSIGLALGEIQVAGVAVLENVQCMYNPSRQTYTLVSNTIGPNSTAEVIVESSDDISYLMKFSNQTKVPGRYANNKLKVLIDGTVQTLEMIFDIRIATYSPTLGYAIDDFSADWRWDFSKGPLFPATPNNGAKIATMIQNKLRENSDGFEKSQCTYYTDSKKFIIYSGTFGVESSVQVLPADDTNRDMAPFVGLDVITDAKSNEYAFTTLQSLYDFLNKWTSLSCSQMSNPVKSCYSLLSLLEDVSVSEQQFILQTTSEYDNAHLGQPRLYSNKLRVDASNNKIDIVDGGTKEIILPYGDFSESELAEIIQDHLNFFGTTVYSVVYKSRPKVFIISTDDPVTFLWNTGVNKATSIGTYIGYTNFANASGQSFVSDVVSFAGEDFFSMASIPQLIPVEHFDWYPPYYYDFEFGEQNWLTVLQILLEAEDNTGTDALDLIKNQTDFFNEVLLDHWEAIASRELQVETAQYEALRQEIAFYSRISTSDATYLNKVAALTASIANRNNLLTFASHASIMNIRSSSQSFVEGVDYDEGEVNAITVDITPVSNDDRIYNRPAPEFRYADNKYLSMKNDTPLYSSVVNFSPFDDVAFTIQSNKTAIPGFAVSGPDVGGTFVIDQPIDTAATMLSLNVEPYDLSGAADTINVSVDGTPVQTQVIQANAAYVESTSILTDSVFVIRNANDKLDYNDGSSHTITITSGVYSGSSLRAEIESKLQAESPATNFTVLWTSNQFTINSTPSVNYLFASGPNALQSIGKMIGFPTDTSGTSVVSLARNIYIQTDINDEFSATVNGILSGNIVITENNYTITAIASALDTAINNEYVDDPVVVTNNTDKIRISTVRKGIGATVTVTIGANDLLKSIYMNTATAVPGSGDVFDITAVTAAEVGDKMTFTISGLFGGGEGSKVRVTTSSARGQLSKIDFIPCPFTSAVGLFVKPTGVDQNNKLSVAINGVDSIIGLNTNASPISGVDVATDMQAKLRAVGSGGFINSFAYYDRYDYPDAFKIVSGLAGPSSSVLVSERTIVINGTNNKIDFEEAVSVQLTATIASGLYDGTELAAAIENAMNAVGASTYTVTYNSSTKKITLSSNGSGGSGTFALLFGTGSSINSAATIMGFFLADKPSPLSHVSDAPIKLQQCFFEVNYDIQTNEPGHDIVDSRLTLTDTYISCTVYWSTGNVEDFRFYFADYPNIKSLLDVLTIEQPDYDVALKSSLWSRFPEKYVVYNNDEFKISIAGAVEQTETFSVTNGSSVSNADPAEVTTLGDTLTLKINGEAAQTITMPTNTMNAAHTAEMIQTLVRILQASNVENQPGYTKFICTYVGDRYYLYSGTQGTDSEVNVTGGSLQSSLKLGSNETAGTGDVANNRFVTIAELSTALSGLTDVDIINDNGFLKFYSEDGDGIEVIPTDLSTRLGFFTDNLSVDPSVNLANVLSASLLRFSNQTIHQHSQMVYSAIPSLDLLVVGTPYAIQTGDVLQVTSTGLPPDPLVVGTDYYAIYVSPTQIKLATSLAFAIAGMAIGLIDTGSGINYVAPSTDPFDMLRGYENRGDITAAFYITDDSLIDSRRPFAVARKTTISGRLSQVAARIPVILSELDPALYDERWQEIVKRLNKKNGPYFKVGEKELGIIRSQETIAENLVMVGEIEDILEV